MIAVAAGLIGRPFGLLDCEPREAEREKVGCRVRPLILLPLRPDQRDFDVRIGASRVREASDDLSFKPDFSEFL